MYFIRLEKTILKFYLGITQERIPSSDVIYMRRTGEYGIENYRLMDTFKKWIKENNLYGENTVIYAVPMDNPGTTEPAQCRYDVCIKQPPGRGLASKSGQVQKAGGRQICNFSDSPHSSRHSDRMEYVFF